METFVVSDTHFNHDNILLPEYSRRGEVVKSTAEMNEMLIRKWNSVVTPRDFVFFLGDFGWFLSKGAKEEKQKLGHTSQQIFDRLNGEKMLIRGNHDEDDHLKLGWSSVVWQEVLKRNKLYITLNHYPMISWMGSKDGVKEDKGIMIHGHIHTRKHLDTRKGRFCVSMDLIKDYTPMSLEEVIQIATVQHGKS